MLKEGKSAVSDSDSHWFAVDCEKKWQQSECVTETTKGAALTILVIFLGQNSESCSCGWTKRKERGALVSFRPALSRVSALLPRAPEPESEWDRYLEMRRAGSACVQGSWVRDIVYVCGEQDKKTWDEGEIGTGTCDIVTIQGRKIKFLLSKVDITQKTHGEEECVHSLFR